MLSEFKGFLLKTNALALAIGVIIGGALGTVVNSLVNDIIMPAVGMVLGGVDFATSRSSSRTRSVGSGDRSRHPLGRLRERDHRVHRDRLRGLADHKMFIKEEVPADVKTCPFCKEANAVDATKCRACASAI